MEFVDFLDLDITSEFNRKAIMEVVFDCLNGLDKKDFAVNPIAIIPKIKKFSSMLIYCGLSDYEASLSKLSENLSAAIGRLNRKIEKGGTEAEIEQIRKECDSVYKELFNLVTEAYINLGKGITRDSHEEPFGLFHQLYYPDNSNKRKAIELIEEALKLIESDNLMPSKARRQIIKQLNRILKNLRSEKTNWSFHFGAIKETIILLAALVTIGGDKYDLEHLSGAKDSLQKASNVIEITSINENYIDFVSIDEQIFKIDNGLKKLPSPDESNTVGNGEEHNQANAADAKSPTAD